MSNSNIHTLAFESFIKMLNENGVKAETITNEVIDDIHYAEFTFCPKYPIEMINLDYVEEAGKITFKETEK